MNKNNRRALAWLVALALILCLSGCRGNTDSRTEITLIHGWGSSDPDHVAMRRIYMDFEADHPDIKINLISMPSADDVVRKVQDMLTVGEMPDVVFTAGAGEELLYEFMVKKGYALDLAPYIEDDPSFRDCIPQVTLSRWREGDGAIYTVSDVLLMSGYWYNKELFRSAGVGDPPATWEDFVKACRRVRLWAQGNNEDVTSIVLDEECLLYLFDAMLADWDETALYELSRGSADDTDSALLDAVDTLKELREYAEMEKQFTYRDTLEVFNTGASAIYVNGVWANTMIYPGLDVEYAAFPSQDGTGISCISSCVGYILGNSSDPQKKDASVAFLKYMLSDNTQERILRETGQIPSSPRIDISSLAENERLLQAVSSVQNAGHVMEVPENLWRSYAREDFLLYLQQELYNIDTE